MEKTLIHVYRPGSFGFADFLRSIYYFSDIAKLHNYTYKIAFNHPIGEFFKNDTNPYIVTSSSYEECMDQIKANNIQIILETNYISFPYKTPKHCIQTFVKPKQTLLDCVDNKIDSMGLKKKKYIVLHIRYGDNDNSICENFIKRIKSILGIVRNQKMPILILCSSSLILSVLNKLPALITTDYSPCHTSSINLDGLKHTLIEFYMMEHAKKIYSISGGTFGTGKSGFSFWASTIFEVPFTHFD